jgi:hypothetical protein
VRRRHGDDTMQVGIRTRHGGTLTDSCASNVNFLACVKAIEGWDLVALRDACQLPANVPLDALADLVARVEHLGRKSPHDIDRAIAGSSAFTWLQVSGRLAETRRLLPAAYAYLGAREPARSP